MPPPAALPPAAPPAAPPLTDDLDHTRLAPATAATGPAAPAGTSRARRARATLLLWDDRRVPLEGTVLIGRDPAPRAGEPAPELVLAIADTGRSVSKTHLAIGVDADGIWLRDRNSTNGTILTLADEQQILCAPEQRIRVPAGASVAFGDYWLTVEE